MSTKSKRSASDSLNDSHTESDAVGLSELDIVERGDEPQPLILLDPRTNAPVLASNGKPATFYVLSLESETMTRFADEQINKLSKRGKTPTAEDNREREITIAARLLMARPWDNMEWIKGQPLAFNFVNAKMLMSKLPWAKRQVSNFASTEANYLGNSSSSSPNSDDTNSSEPSDHPAAA